jgi:hypothetical protein
VLQLLTVPLAEPPTLLDQPLPSVDPQVAEALARERHRQQSTLEMIASENFAPLAVMQARPRPWPRAALTATTSRKWRTFSPSPCDPC